MLCEGAKNPRALVAHGRGFRFDFARRWRVLRLRLVDRRTGERLAGRKDEYRAGASERVVRVQDRIRPRAVRKPSLGVQILRRLSDGVSKVQGSRQQEGEIAVLASFALLILHHHQANYRDVFARDWSSVGQ